MENVLYDSTVVAELEEAEDILSNNDELKTNSKWVEKMSCKAWWNSVEVEIGNCVESRWSRSLLGLAR